MRGRESEPKVRRKSGNEMGRRRWGGRRGSSFAKQWSLRRHTWISVFKKLHSSSFALLNNQEVGERIDRPGHGARLSSRHMLRLTLLDLKKKISKRGMEIEIRRQNNSI